MIKLKLTSEYVTAYTAHSLTPFMSEESLANIKNTPN